MTGLERIQSVFAQAKASGGPSSCPTTPWATRIAPRTLDIIRALGANGAGLFEIGIPHSDPLADGPTIQTATYTALMQGTTVKRLPGHGAANCVRPASSSLSAP